MRSWISLVYSQWQEKKMASMMQSSVVCVLWFTVYCCPFRRATSNVTFRCEKVLTFSSWELQVFGSNIKRTNLTSIMKVVTDKEMRNAKFPKYKHVFRSWKNNLRRKQFCSAWHHENRSGSYCKFIQLHAESLISGLFIPSCGWIHFASEEKPCLLKRTCDIGKTKLCFASGQDCK